MNYVLQKQSMRHTLDIFRVAPVEHPTLANLSYCLRNPDTWPEGFHWNYEYCERCAMGLARALWRQSIPHITSDTGSSVMARAFHMSYEGARAIFFGSAYMRRTILGRMRVPQRLITPEMVADAIDEYLAETARKNKR